MMTSLLGRDWMPAVCTLPTIEQPLWVAEFADLFADSLTRIENLTPQHARLHLVGDSFTKAHDLAVRETSCCSFFTIDVQQHPDAVTMDIHVPEVYTDVLAALVASAGGTLV